MDRVRWTSGTAIRLSVAPIAAVMTTVSCLALGSVASAAPSAGSALVNDLRVACDALLQNPTPDNAKAVSNAWFRAPGTAKINTSETRVSVDPGTPDIVQSQIEESVIDRFGTTRTLFIQTAPPAPYPMVYIRQRNTPGSVVEYRSNRTTANTAPKYDRAPMRWYRSPNRITGDPLHGAVKDPLDSQSAVWPLQFIIGTQGAGGGDFAIANGTISYTTPGSAYLAANPVPDLTARPTAPLTPGYVWGSDSWVLSDRCTKLRYSRDTYFNFPSSSGGFRSRITITSDLVVRDVPDIYVPRGKYVTKQ